MSFHKQLTDGLAIANSHKHVFELYRNKPFKNIVIAGMGGSAIAGDFIKSIFSETLNIPIFVSRDYLLPAFVSPETLCIMSSYSGNTEETLSALQDALRKKASVLAIATGGGIESVCLANNIEIIKIPRGLQPRQALGYSLTLLYSFMSSVFLSRDESTAIQRAASMLQLKSREYGDANGSLVETAKRISGRPVIIYSSERLFPASVRLKGQISENAKLLAFCNTFPEMNHNEIVGWDSVTKGTGFPVLYLRDRNDHPQVHRRFEICADILRKKTDLFEFWAEGETLFEKFIFLIFLGDWLSYYMTLDRRYDPTPVDIIVELKNKLSK